MRLRNSGWLLLASALAACATAAPNPGRDTARMLSQMPSWFQEPLDNQEQFFQGRATSVSWDMQLAIDGAATDARTSLAQSIESYVTAIVSTATSQAGEAGNESATRLREAASRQVVANTLRSVQIDRQEVRAEADGRIRAFVRVRMMKGEAAAALRAQVAREQELYARFRGTEALRQLDSQVAQYERMRAGGAPTSVPADTTTRRPPPEL